MTSPGITDEMVNKFNGAFYCAGRDGAGHVESIRIGLQAVAPMILEANNPTLGMLRAAYLAGWEASAEGYNAEHGCDSPLTNGAWLARADEKITAIRALKGGE